MKNTEIAFYSFKQFGYLLMHIGGNGNSIAVFCLSSMYLKDKAFKYFKNQNLFWQFQVTFHMYLDVEIEGDDDNDYDDAKIYQQRLQ